MKKINTQVKHFKLTDEDLRKFEIARQRALKYLPDGMKLRHHDATEDDDPTYITFEDEIGYEYHLRTPEGNRIRAMRRLKASGLDSVAERYTFDAFTTKEPFQAKMKKIALQFTSDYQGKWFSMLGQSGAGKSHLCTAIAVELIKLGCDVEYMLWVDKLNEVRYDTDYYRSFMYRMKNCEVLYIDDLFKTGRGFDKLSDFEVKAAFEILNYRYNKRLTTILSTELGFQDFKDLNSAVIGRIKEMSKGYYVELLYDEKRNYRLTED